METAKPPSQVSLPSVPLPQFGAKEFSIDHFNTTVASIAKQINALSPVNPNVRIRAQFLAQFHPEDFKDDTLGFINSQFVEIVKNVNKLSPQGNTQVQPVQLIQLKAADFEKPGIPEVAQFLTNIIVRLNAVRPQF